MKNLVEIKIEIDAELASSVKKIFQEYNLTIEQATILFYEEVVKRKALPFEIEKPIFDDSPQSNATI